MSSQALGQRFRVTFSPVAYNGRGLPKAQRVGLCWEGFWQAGVRRGLFSIRSVSI